MRTIVNGKDINLTIDYVGNVVRKKNPSIRYVKKDGKEYPQYDITVRVIANEELNGYEKECICRRITSLLEEAK